MKIQDIENEIVEEFSAFTDWMDKYEYLIDLGKNLPIIDNGYKTDGNLINGCQSRVWLSCTISDGKLYFSADSDAIITKGIISLLIRVFNGQSPEDILKSDLGFIDKIGLKENLSPTRANGLLSMIKQIKLYALAFSEKRRDIKEEKINKKEGEK
ncbi:MAG: SufE family protein [Bacteroidales bacterium]|jgi:cysteine desulfuration protein SufE|nr:SufE family protein [Bacteroidales bacterium]